MTFQWLIFTDFRPNFSGVCLFEGSYIPCQFSHFFGLIPQNKKLLIPKSFCENALVFENKSVHHFDLSMTHFYRFLPKFQRGFVFPTLNGRVPKLVVSPPGDFFMKSRTSCSVARPTWKMKTWNKDFIVRGGSWALR